MPSQFPITAGDPSTRFQLPSGSVSVAVANPTEQWLHLLDTYYYVPPGTIGAVYSLDGLPNPGAEWTAPPGVSQPASVTGQQAALTYYQVALPPSSGTVIQVTSTVSGNVSVSAVNSTVTTNAPQIALGGLSDNTGTGTSSGRNLGAGTQALAFAVADITKIAHLKVVGNVTNLTYLELYFFTQSIYAIPVLSVLDTGIVITVQSTGGGITATVYPVALQESVPEFLQLYAPPQLAANQLPLGFLRSLAGGASPVALVTETTNVGLWLFNSLITCNQTAFELWEGTAATPKGTLIGSYTNGNAITAPIPFAGSPLARGQGVYLNNPSATVAITVAGTINYSKG